MKIGEMSSKSEREANLEELIASFRSTDENLIFLEGSDDIIIMEQILADLKFGDFQFNLINCGGREKLLQIFISKSAIKGKAFFLCDSDLWLFTGVPEEYLDHKDLLYTEGYSIENEVFCDGLSFIKSLMRTHNEIRFNQLLHSIIRKYSAEVEDFIKSDIPPKFDSFSVLNLNIIPKQSVELSDSFVALHRLNHASDEWYIRIFENPEKLVRGKYLLQIVSKITDEDTNIIKYTENQLIQAVITHCLASDNSPRLKKIKSAIIAHF